MGQARIWLYGAGNYGEFVLEALRVAGLECTGIFDSHKKGFCLDMEILRTVDISALVKDTDIVLISCNSVLDVYRLIRYHNVSACVASFGQYLDQSQGWGELSVLNSSTV